MLLKRPDALCAAALFALALAVYARTLCPGLYWGDCGELAAAAYTLGITHPTGYPLWCLLGKAWTLAVPLGTIILRLNALSAVLGAGAVAALFGAARALGLPRPLAALAVGLFAFCAAFWQQCLFAETYSFTTLWTATLIGLALRWRARGCGHGDLRLLAIAYGFALTCGLVNTLFLPGFLLFLLSSNPSLRRWREPSVRRVWGRTLGLGALPLLFYAYLPLRAGASPLLNWGDPRTPYAFFYHVTGRAYAALMFHMTPLMLWQSLEYCAARVGQAFDPRVLWLAPVGLFSLWTRDKGAAGLLTWVLVADSIYTVNYDVYNRFVYLLPFLLTLALLIGEGLRFVWALLSRPLAPSSATRLARLAAACALLLVPLQILAHWRSCDLHRMRACDDYGRNILASVPPGGLLVDNGQDTSHAAVLYLQSVEGVRPDVLAVQRQMLAGIYDMGQGRWANVWYWQALQRQDPALRHLYAPGGLTRRRAVSEDPLRRLLAAAAASGRPVAVLRAGDNPFFYDDQEHPTTLPAYLASHYDLAPVGLLLRVYPRGHRPPPAVLLAQTEALWRVYPRRALSTLAYSQDAFLTPIALDYASAALARARLAWAQGDYRASEDAYRTVLRLCPSDEADAGLARCAAVRRKRLALAP